ncbi:hypothetical protein AAY473_015164, partial [Plecturocebus cupreus]
MLIITERQSLGVDTGPISCFIKMPSDWEARVSRSRGQEMETILANMCLSCFVTRTRMECSGDIIARDSLKPKLKQCSCLSLLISMDYMYLIMPGYLKEKETRFHYVGQAGLELLTSVDPLASASQMTQAGGSRGQEIETILANM